MALACASLLTADLGLSDERWLPGLRFGRADARPPVTEIGTEDAVALARCIPSRGRLSSRR